MLGGWLIQTRPPLCHVCVRPDAIDTSRDAHKQVNAAAIYANGHVSIVDGIQFDIFQKSYGLWTTISRHTS